MCLKKEKDLLLDDLNIKLRMNCTIKRKRENDSYSRKIYRFSRINYIKNIASLSER